MLASAVTSSCVVAGPKDQKETQIVIPAAKDRGAVVQDHFYSTRLKTAVDLLVYLPANYSNDASVRYRVVYLLHGRGDSMRAWLEAKPELDRLIHSGRIPPLIAVMPDAPFSRRASYYVDSEYSGLRDGAELPEGQPVESVFTTELLAHVDARYRTRPDRDGRIVAGYSMGGYGALRFALSHPELFSRAIVLSPAVYVPLPPAASSTREFGAFGRGPMIFDGAVYEAKNYPALLPMFERTGLRLTLFVAVGDQEPAVSDPAEATHDLDYEAHTLYNRLRRVPKLDIRFRVVGGGHGWDTWRPCFADGLEYLFAR